MARVLDPQLESLIRAGEGMPRMEDQTPDGARRIYAETMQQFAEAALPMARVENRAVPGPEGPVPVRIFRPRDAGEQPPILVFFHGGGWVLGDIDSYDPVTRRIADGARCVVVSVDYRLAPEHKFPAAVEDCLAAFRWVAAEAESLKGDPVRVAVGGDSAGGNLAAVVSQLAAAEPGPKPCLQFLLYPVTQLRTDTPSYSRYAEGYILTRDLMRWFIRHYCRTESDVADPRAAPLLAEDHAGLPPTLLTTAGFDVLQDEGRAYVEKLKRAGVQVRHRMFESLVHGYFSMSAIVESARVAADASLGDLREAFRALPDR